MFAPQLYLHEQQVIAGAERSMKRSFIGDVIRTLGTSAAVAALGVAASVVMARALGPEGKGSYAIVIQSISILITLGQFGLPEMMLYQMRAGRRRPDALAGNSMLILIATSLLVAMGLWIMYPMLADTLYKGVSSSLLWLAFWMVPSNLGFLFYSRLIQLDGRVEAYNALNLMQAGTWMLALLAWLWIWPDRAEAAVLGLVTSQALTALCSVLLVRRWVAGKRWHWDWKLMSESLRGGMKVQVGMAAALLGQQLGIFVLNSFLDLCSVGWFSTALGLTNFLLLASASVRTVLQAWMPGASVNPSVILERTVTATRHTAIVLLMGAVILAILGRPLIRVLYGAPFLPAYMPMLILLPSVLVRGISQVFTSYFAFEKRLGLPSVAAALAVGSNAVLAWLLVPQLGMTGAALATFAGQLASMLFLAAWFTRLTDRRLSELVPAFADLRLYVSVLMNR